MPEEVGVRVARLPYLNVEPFHRGLEAEPGFSLTPMFPSDFSRLARMGMVHAGPLPITDFFKLEGAYIPLADFCVAVGNRAGSVLLFSKPPPDELSGKTVVVTEQSSVSKVLLRLLLGRALKVERVRYEEGQFDEEADGYLAIGDEALHLKKSRGKDIRAFSHRTDLGELWHDWTGLPFVFARWAYREDLPKRQARRIAELLEESLGRGRGTPFIGAMAKRHKMTPRQTGAYLKLFTYRMGERETEGANRFRELVGES